VAERLLISQGEAARQLGVSRLTLIAEIGKGRLRYVLVGKRRKFKPEDLTSYIERQGRGCDGTGALLPGGQGRPTGTKTSRSTVIDFEEALKQTTATKPRSSPQRSESDALLGKLTGKKPELTLSQALGRYLIEHGQHLASADDIARMGRC
jgi:excisionase family DNA binding protein